MSKYSPGIIMARVLGELEAKAAGCEAINPEHLWMGLCKLSELTEAAIAKFLQADETDQTQLIGEIEKLLAWFKSRLLMTTKMRRPLRAMAGTTYRGDLKKRDKTGCTPIKETYDAISPT